jgi:cyclohexyl-isocyanide hydratase
LIGAPPSWHRIGECLLPWQEVIDNCQSRHSRWLTLHVKNGVSQAPTPGRGHAGEWTVETPALFTVGMVLYPNFALLDLVGPQRALALHGRTLLLSKDRDRVVTDTGLALSPTTPFGECPTNLDVLFVPGGFGTIEAMKDERLIAFVSAAGRNARYIASVGSGSLLLGMAGLLDGYKSATHWPVYEALAATGALPVKQRVVTDRNHICASGGTAGIDLGITLLAALRGEYAAKVTQLIMEYDPKPPYDCGTPDKAGPALVAGALDLICNLDREALEIARSRRHQVAA